MTFVVPQLTVNTTWKHISIIMIKIKSWPRENKPQKCGVAKRAGIFNLLGEAIYKQMPGPFETKYTEALLLKGTYESSSLFLSLSFFMIHPIQELKGWAYFLGVL